MLIKVFFSVGILGPDHDRGLLPRSLSVIFNSIDGRLYSRSDLKPQRCRDYSRLTPDQQAAEISDKKNLLRPFKEVRILRHCCRRSICEHMIHFQNVSWNLSHILSRMYFVFVSAGWKSIFKVDISGWFVIPSQISFPVQPETLTPPFVCSCPGSSLTDSSVNSTSEADTLGLSFTSNVCFSVWVSFCEIYNDNIHDLLDQVKHSRSQLVTYAAWAKRSILSICNIFSNMNWIVLQL